MKVRKRLKRGYALALAVLLGLSCLIHMQTQAAVRIEADRTDCTLTVSVAASPVEDEFQKDLNEMKIPVKLYRVAEVDQVGRYTSVAPFNSDVNKVDLSGINSETKAEDWLKLADDAMKCLTENTQADRTGTIESGSLTFTGLATGMYLVVPEETYNLDYTVLYKFTPYLTALPSSVYTTTGEGSDDWNYTTTIGLKAEGEEQFGKLIINKNLNNYNETLGTASFVFRVEGRDDAGTLVYSKVISTEHSGMDPQQVTLDPIPAGLEVTVTEEYPGASYRVVGLDTYENVLIWSDAAVENGHETAAVAFTNEYDGGNRGGYGVTNRFDTDGSGGWNWTALEPEAEE